MHCETRTALKKGFMETFNSSAYTKHFYLAATPMHSGTKTGLKQVFWKL